MAETRKTTKSKTTAKAKPVAKTTKKPATKAASTTSKATAAKTTRSTTTSRPTTAKKASTPAHHEGKFSKAIFMTLIIVAAIAVIAGFIAVAVCQTCRRNDLVSIENGKGEQVEARYISLDNYNYSIAIPTSFKVLSTEEIEKEYGKEDAPVASFENEGGTINILIQKPENKLANDQIKEYLEATKTILATSANIIETDYYTVDDHNVGTIRVVSTNEGEKFYSQMAIFSYEDKLAIITFSCKDSERAEWEKVGQAVIKSLKFTK